MSEFIAEAQVLVRPDTTKFRTELLAQLALATKGLSVPIPVTAVASGTAGLSQATGALASAQSKAIRTSAELAGAQDQVARSAKNSTASLLGAATATSRLDAALLGLRTAVGSTAVIGLGALALAAIAAGKAVSASIRNFAAFEQELATFRVIAGATAEQMKAVREESSRLGADVRLPAVSAADAAVAMTELAKAGLSVEEAMAGAEGVLQLATAAQISNADAAQISANALNAFGLAGDQAIRVADDLANAANAAQGSISDFGLALAQSSAVARQVGLSLEDTTAILSLFAKNGLQGSDAGTSLRVALIKLVAPTAKAAAEIKNLGLNIRDAQGNVRADVFAQFGDATKNLTPAARDAAAALIFGQDAIRAVSIGAREGVDGLRLMQFQIDQTGTAAEIAAARTEGLSGSLSALQSGAETLSISFGELISGRLRPLVDAVAADVSAVNKLIEKFKELEDAIPGSGGGGGSPLNDFFSGLPEQADELQRVLGGILQGKNLKFGTLEFKDAVTGAANLVKLNEQLQALQDARVAAQEGGQRGIADSLTKEIAALREEIRVLKDDSKGIDAGVTAPLQKAVDKLKEVRDIRISLNIDTAPIDRLIASLERQIPITQQVEGNLQRLRDDVDGLGSSSNQTATAVDKLTASLKQLGSQSAQAQAELLRLQTEGGTPQQEIAVLQSDIAVQRKIIEDAKKRGGPGTATAITAARNQIKSDQAQIDSLQAEIDSASTAAAKKITDAQSDAAKKFQDALDAALRGPESLLARAGGTDLLGDDIKFRKQIIAILEKKKDNVLKILGDTADARKIIEGINDRILQESIKLSNDQKAFRQQLRDNLVAKLERVQRGIELDIELADINENTKKRISLRQQLIAQLKREAKVLHLTGNALKENRNERARIQAEIDAINEEEKKGKDSQRTFAQASFEFLQQQQGFAANLLGNLIPSGAAEGLVGGASQAGVSAIRTPGVGVAQESQIAAGKDVGFSAGQGNTTNELLRQIRDALKVLNGSQQAPEARTQRVMQSGSAEYQAM